MIRTLLGAPPTEIGCSDLTVRAYRFGESLFSMLTLTGILVSVKAELDCEVQNYIVTEKQLSSSMKKEEEIFLEVKEFCSSVEEIKAEF